jgi:CRP-like cAMP-binding protein
VQALENSVVHSISKDNLAQLFAASKTWEKAGRILAEKAYVMAVQRVNRLLHDSTATRFETFLHESPQLLQRVPQYLIASYLDMALETLSRLKRKAMKNPVFAKTIHGSLP